ncbi:MAG: hypothetical protein INR73_02270 [Williamsia sp.]|nr:hypothetical protein [Williamsia sp.]
MEKDQQLKEILLQGSERASIHFTDAVMERVHKLSATPYFYQPLVPPQVKKAFIIVWMSLVGAIFLTCFLLVSPQLPLGDWLTPQPVAGFVSDHGYTILAYIGCFWILFAANLLAEKMLGRRITF